MPDVKSVLTLTPASRSIRVNYTPTVPAVGSVFAYGLHREPDDGGYVNGGGLDGYTIPGHEFFDISMDDGLRSYTYTVRAYLDPYYLTYIESDPVSATPLPLVPPTGLTAHASGSVVTVNWINATGPGSPWDGQYVANPVWTYIEFNTGGAYSVAASNWLTAGGAPGDTLTTYHHTVAGTHTVTYRAKSSLEGGDFLGAGTFPDSAASPTATVSVPGPGGFSVAVVLGIAFGMGFGF